MPLPVRCSAGPARRNRRCGAVPPSREPPELGRIWRQLGAIEQAAPKRWMDAYLAAFAIAAGLSLISLDQDFRQFEPEGLTLQLLQAAGRPEEQP